MCGIFGIIANKKINAKDLTKLATHARRRGKDSSGILYADGPEFRVVRADYDVKKLLNQTIPLNTNILLGHSRLITNGLYDNQPVIYDNIGVLHNGIVVNEDELWTGIKSERRLSIDSEVIAALIKDHLDSGGNLEGISNAVLSKCKGVVACATILPELGKLVLFSNNGSLYLGTREDDTFFSSEAFPLTSLGCNSVKQIKNSTVILEIPTLSISKPIDMNSRTENIIPEFKFIKNEESLLEYSPPALRRCTKCILPETMPFITFDKNGVCNYCNNYKIRNTPKNKEELFDLVEPYRNIGPIDCIVPFSGGRDSCYGLHLIVKELKLKPVTYTYDWGMVTDIGRRNISRMCSKLGVENIIIAADIEKKRDNIRKNLVAWLRSPHLGMISILTAGDKHFFRYVEDIKRQTGVNLNLWGINPLEVTHFKAGFLGVKPYFEEDKVYSHGLLKQLKYHYLRTKAMLESPGYFNSSLWDTLSGEYHRSFTEKQDYYHIFDYWRWDESVINKTLIMEYEWETSTDTSTTWRIGDGTAAFYNYIYHTVAGFTEHDTFRSNQIREGQITREEALNLVKEENQPRYQNIKWYLDTLGLDFSDVIKCINQIEKLY